MAKKASWYMEAERLFVQQHMTVESIAGQLPVSERTIGDWRREGQWDKLRSSFVESNSKTHEKLYTLIQKLTDKAIQSAEDGEEPSQSQLYFIGKMAPLMLRLQTYEETTEKPAEEAAPKKQGLSEETIRKIEEEILGLKR